MDDERNEVATVLYVNIQVFWFMTPCHCVTAFKRFDINLCFASKREKKKDIILALKILKSHVRGLSSRSPQKTWMMHQLNRRQRKIFDALSSFSRLWKSLVYLWFAFGQIEWAKPCSVEVRNSGEWWDVMNLGRSARKQVGYIIQYLPGKSEKCHENHQ